MLKLKGICKEVAEIDACGVEESICESRTDKGSFSTVPGIVNGQTYLQYVNNASGLCKGHQVESAFVDLLNNISKEHPETFDNFSPQSEIFHTIDLNALCIAVSEVGELSRTKVADSGSSLDSFNCLFADLRNLGLNIEWLERLYQRNKSRNFFTVPST